ncbi:hypothetical protein LTS18_001431, partial [Coniosporium uncinatum]
ERPCTRCIKRNIGHLCHDEPRESTKKGKSDSTAGLEEKKLDSPLDVSSSALEQHANVQDAGLNLGPRHLSQSALDNETTIVHPSPVSAPQLSALTDNNQPCTLHQTVPLASYMKADQKSSPGRQPQLQ